MNNHINILNSLLKSKNINQPSRERLIQAFIEENKHLIDLRSLISIFEEEHLDYFDIIGELNHIVNPLNS